MADKLRRMSDYFYGRKWSVEGKTPLWPRRCHKSKRWLWIEPAYKISRLITGPGEPIEEIHWLSPEEFLVARLKDEL